MELEKWLEKHNIKEMVMKDLEFYMCGYKEEEEEDYKYNDDKKTAAELERERIEAEKEAQRKRQSAPKIGGGVKKNTVSAD